MGCRWRPINTISAFERAVGSDSGSVSKGTLGVMLAPRGNEVAL
jgi:hypothetical protein